MSADKPFPTIGSDGGKVKRAEEFNRQLHELTTLPNARRTAQAGGALRAALKAPDLAEAREWINVAIDFLCGEKT